MSDEPGAGKAVGGHVFISHVPDDPDWPSDQIEVVADAVRDAGIAVRMDLWSQPEGARFQSIGAWHAWLNEVVIGAKCVICLVSPRYETVWGKRLDSTVEGLALEAVSVISFSNRDRSAGRSRLISLLMEQRDLSAVPTDFFYFPSFQWPTDRAELISWLKGKEDPGYSHGNLRALEDAISAARQSAEQLSSTTLHLLGELSPEGISADVDAPDAQIGSEHASAGSPVLDHNGETSIFFEAQAISHASVSAPRIEIVAAPDAVQRRELHRASTGNSGMWPSEDAWRAPVGDFPPPWASAWGDDVYGLWADLTVNGATQRMRWIEPSGPKGFWMGSTKQERAAIKSKDVRQWANQSEHEPRRVVIEQGFWLADTPCTQAFWHAVTGKNPSYFQNAGDTLEHPVENVSWNAVMEQFIARLAKSPRLGIGDVLCLPTEAEWEYAARSGTSTAYWWGEEWDATRGNANVTGERGWQDIEGCTPMRRYAPNHWGLFDVHGNVWEWCSDLWQQRWDAPDARPNQDWHVVRGGSWFGDPSYARAAYRRRWHRGDANHTQGFRFALRYPAASQVG